MILVIFSLLSAKHWDSGLSQVDLFDARRRPWFIQGATSPKNIVILIDASGSMHGVPMRIAKLSAQNLIDTFGDNDFFNVVYVSKLSVTIKVEFSQRDRILWLHAGQSVPADFLIIFLTCFYPNLVCCSSCHYHNLSKAM